VHHLAGVLDEARVELSAPLAACGRLDRPGGPSHPEGDIGYFVSGKTVANEPWFVRPECDRADLARLRGRLAPAFHVSAWPLQTGPIA